MNYLQSGERIKVARDHLSNLELKLINAVSLTRSLRSARGHRGHGENQIY